MRVVLSLIEAPAATASAAHVADAVRAVADERELTHVYASHVTGRYGVVLYLLTPLETAAAVALRILFEVAEQGEFGPDWIVAELAAWNPTDDHLLA